MQAWEYVVVEGTPLNKKVGPQFMEDLAQLGRQGWEAVGLMPVASTSGHCQVLLKRPIQ